MRHPAPVPIPRSVAEVLDPALHRRPWAEALVDDRQRLTYEEVELRVRATASGLSEAGVEGGDRVMVSLPNSADIVILLLAVMRLGAVWVGIHPKLSRPEQAWMAEDCGARLVVGSPPVIARLRESGDVTAALVEVDVEAEGLSRLEGEQPPPRRSIDLGQPAAIAYTSGTTGRPKGVVHDHHHALLTGSVILNHRMSGRGERIGVHLPLTTFNLMILGPLLAFQGGGTCLCTELRGADLASWVRDESVEHLSTAPATVYDLIHASDVDETALRDLRLGVGGAACPEGLRHAYRERFGRDFTSGYGLTEVPSAVTQETESVPHVPGASGTAMAHLEVVISEPDGTPLPAGTEGEICVAPARTGPWAGTWQGMLGYWQRPAESAAARHGSLLRTSDVGWLDEKGYLFVGDRRSDLIVRGGSNVYPAEIRRVLLDHQAVADCTVLGRPHPRLGEEVAAAIELHTGASASPEELRRHCSATLASYKVPAEIITVPGLPRNPMGKVIRSEIRSLFADNESELT